MTYSGLRAGALVMLIILFTVLTHGINQDVQTVMVDSSPNISIETLARSIKSINTIEYAQLIKTTAAGENMVKMHYYYKRPYYLRVETISGNNKNIDIYTPEGMYEYFPQSNAAYYREKWKDYKPVSFQMEDKLSDIKIKGKYEFLKMDNVFGVDCEILRNVDEDEAGVYEHRIWLGSIDNIKLPIREEYLTDGDVTMTCEYQYISINHDLESSLFQLKPSENLKIYDAEGIPKTVKDEKEAEKYVKFDVDIPKYVPKGFKINEICIIPPIKNPSVLVTYGSDIDTIYYSQKWVDKSELEIQENDKVGKAGGIKFAVRKLFNDSVSVRWINNGIEFEFSGSYTLKEEIVKLIYSLTGLWVAV